MRIKITFLFAAIAGISTAQSIHPKLTGNPPVANFSVSDTSICAGVSVNFTDLSTNSPASWKWTFTGGTPDTSTIQNPTNILYSTPGSYLVKLVVKNGNGSDSLTIPNYIKVYSRPNGKVTDNIGNTCICQFDSVRLVATGGNYYEWGPLNSKLNHYGPLPLPHNDTDVNMAAPNITTIYRVYVHRWGCWDTAYDTVCVVPGAKANVCCDTTVASGTHVLLTATPYAQTIVNKWAGPGLNKTVGDSVIATPASSSWYYVYLENEATGCIFKDSIFIDVFAGIPSISNPMQLKVSPNPVKNILSVTFDTSSDEKTEIHITDITGRMLFTYDIQPATNQYPVNVSGLVSGMYFLTLKTSKGLVVTKFVKE